MSKINTLAFYLPQFHPIPENNQWWGPGFTEWTNVSRSLPRFKGHHQPQIPADLGFYDLRLSDTRFAQAEMAKRYGVTGFCYYHYWFNSKTLLDFPLQEKLRDIEDDFPFCICWANENWTRAWDGLDRQILIRQQYSNSDDIAHFRHILPIISDKRYIKINGMPMVLIYRPDIMPNFSNFIKLWKGMAASSGLPGLYICAVKTGFYKGSDEDLIRAGANAIVDFQPNAQYFKFSSDFKSNLQGLLKNFIPDSLYQTIKINIKISKKISYKKLSLYLSNRQWPIDYRIFPCVFPSWDNSARRKSATIIQNDYPDDYGNWLASAIDAVSNYHESERFIFINAWNEWAEGCHLEPDLKMGHSFLEQTQLQISRHNNSQC